MASVGEKLRRARLDQGLDLAQVADRTKIGTRYLEAIEADNRQGLPGGFFYKNWVQQYAMAVALDVEAISGEVDRVIANDSEPALPGQDRTRLPKEMRPPPMNVAGRPPGAHRLFYSLGLLVAVVLGCSASYAWWHNSQVNAAALETKPRVETKAERVAAAPPAPSKAAQTTPTPATPTKIEPPPVPAAAPQEADRENSNPSPSDDVQIEVAATEATWLSIVPDGRQGFSGVLQPAEVQTVAAHEKARIRIGNAAGVEVRLNGKSIGPIGSAGQVRIVVIDREGFRIVEPKPLTLPDGASLNDHTAVAPAFSQ